MADKLPLLVNSIELSNKDNLINFNKDNLVNLDTGFHHEKQTATFMQIVGSKFS